MENPKGSRIDLARESRDAMQSNPPLLGSPPALAGTAEPRHWPRPYIIALDFGVASWQNPQRGGAASRATW